MKLPDFLTFIYLIQTISAGNDLVFSIVLTVV